MGNASSAHAMAESMRRTSRASIKAEIDKGDEHAGFYAQRVSELMVKIAETCTAACSETGLAGVREVILMIHEWVDALDTNCPQCQLPELANEVLTSADPEWDTAKTEEFATRYMLSVCGFVDADGLWHVDNNTLAHIVSRLNKAELIIKQSVDLLSHDASEARKNLEAARDMATVAMDMARPSPTLTSSVQVALGPEAGAESEDEAGPEAGLEAGGEARPETEAEAGGEAGEIDDLASVVFNPAT